MAKHILDTRVASEYGVNVALLLENLAYWIHKNLTNKKHLHDGLCWTYNSLEAFARQFPYWTRRQLETVINNAEKSGLLVKGNYNAVKYDRTVWYALTQKAYQYFDQLQDKELLQAMYLTISPKCEMEFAEWGNGFLRTVTPIPNTKPNTKPYINNKGVSDEPRHVENNSEKIFDESNEKSNLCVISNNQEENTNQFENDNNQTLHGLEDNKGLEGSSLSTKSDYRNNQT